jgi:hypothetical protein
MSSREFYSQGSSIASQGLVNISSPEESSIGQSNYTTKYYGDRPSNRISNYSSYQEDIFDTECMKTYERPIDSSPAPKLTTKEVQNLKKKFTNFISKQSTVKTLRSKSPTGLPVSRKKSEVNVSPLTPVISHPSHKKPLITLSLQVGGNDINEDVYQGDNSLEISKRIFAKAGINASKQGLKSLSEIVYNAVGDYMAEVSSELSNFQRNSKKVLEKYSKGRLLKFKPPLLATERRAEEKRMLIGSVNINLQGKDIVVPLRQGDDPEKIANKVLADNFFTRDSLPLILQPIRELIDNSNKKFLFRVELEVNGKVADVVVYEDDDLNTIATKFVRENKLGRENISKIEDLLKKQLKLINS